MKTNIATGIKDLLGSQASRAFLPALSGVQLEDPTPAAKVEDWTIARL
ncbi:hypothetical protein IQ269_28260 [Tychonema sp. LEGE 07199]|nr:MULTISPECIES: hypothetical protein [unclassified Tychonema]MBE9124558.1 hypothetical protein [Tychonema sp. LEGE 07199]MBE9135594.1 hypothetical protein [Tychonema sp. LEGE 07196]